MGEIGTSLFGYNKGQVDLLLQQHNDKISSLESQVQELEKQLANYIAMEDTLKEGILDARAKGSEIVQESNQKAERLIHQTHEQVAQFKEDFVDQGSHLLNSGLALKNRLDFMKMEMLEMVEQVTEFIEATDFDTVFPKTDLDRFNHAMTEFAQEQLAIEPVRDLKAKADSAMTDEEKRELEKLIQEVMIANDSQTKIQKEVGSSDKKLIDLRAMKG